MYLKIDDNVFNGKSNMIILFFIFYFYMVAKQ